jgi:hypothetical protein
MSSLQDILGELRTRFGFEVLEPTITDTQVRALGRVRPQDAARWKAGREHILSVEGRAAWSVDISRKYFLRDGVEVYAWRIIFQGPALAAHAQHIVSTLRGVPQPQVQVEEQLIFRGKRPLMNSNGKGAAPIGATPLLLQKRQGAG